jgi:putative oxidoreductase
MQDLIHRVSRLTFNRSLGLLIVRVAVGSIFFSHGLMKVQNIAKTVAMFHGFGFPPIVAVFIAWLEVVGGAALAFGIAPRIFGALFGIEMLVAVFLVTRMHGFQGLLGMEMLLAAVSFGIMLIGSGRYALYTMECATCNGLMCIKNSGVCVVSAA